MRKRRSGRIDKAYRYLSGYCGEGEKRFARKVNNTRSARTDLVIAEQVFGTRKLQKRAFEIASGYTRKCTVNALGSVRWRVDLISEDVFGERFSDSQIEPSQQLGQGFAPAAD